MACLAILFPNAFGTMRIFVAIDACLSLDRSELSYGYRFFLLMTARAGGICMSSFEHEIFTVVKKGSGFKPVLVVAFFAVACGIATAMNIFVAGHAFLFKPQKGGRARLRWETGQHKRFFTFFLMTFFAGQIIVAAV